jgi:hypothetical protein
VECAGVYRDLSAILKWTPSQLYDTPPGLVLINGGLHKDIKLCPPGIQGGLYMWSVKIEYYSKKIIYVSPEAKF